MRVKVVLMRVGFENVQVPYNGVRTSIFQLLVFLASRLVVSVGPTIYSQSDTMGVSKEHKMR